MDCNCWGNHTDYEAMVYSTYIGNNVYSLPIDHLVSKLVYTWGSEIIEIY